MNRLLCAASLLALIVPAVAAAQQQDDGHKGGQHSARPQNAPGHGQTQAPAHGQMPQSRPGRPAGPQNVAPARPAPSMASRPGRPQQSAIANHTTVQSYRRTGARAANIRPVQAPSFQYPRGYHYRRWSVGLILPSIFLTNYYFYNDWSALGA